MGTAALSFNPSVYAFAKTSIGRSSQAAFTLTNASSADVSLKGFSGLASPLSVVTSDCPLASGKLLASGASCQITVQFAPTATGDATGTLDVAYILPSSPDATLNALLGLTASSITVGNSALTATPAMPSFGAARVQTSTSQTLTLTNVAASPLYLLSLLGFDQNFSQGATNCPFGAGASSLAPGDSCQLTVNFSPQTVGVLTASITINFGLSSAGAGGLFTNLALTGTGVSSLLFAGVSSIGPPGANTSSQLKVNWPAPTQGTAVRYFIYHVDGSGAVTYVADVPSTQLAYTDSGLSPDTTYTYLVKAVDILGVPDANTTQVSATTDPQSNFSQFSIGSMAEGQTTVSAALSCTPGVSKSPAPTPTYSVAGMSDPDINCTIAGSGPYQLSCTPNYKAGP